MKKIFSLLLMILISINFISSEGLSCYMAPHFFSNGQEVVNDNSTIISGISIDIFCNNLLKDQRILSLSISNSSPIDFTNSLPKKQIDFIRILEKDKLLFSSEVIPNTFNETNITFSVEIIGLSEKSWEFQKYITSKTIYLPSKINKKEDLIKSFGNLIMPSNYKLGAFIGIAIFILVILLIWYTSSTQKINKWRDSQRRKKMLKIQQEEKWKQQRG